MAARIVALALILRGKALGGVVTDKTRLRGVEQGGEANWWGVGRTGVARYVSLGSLPEPVKVA